MNSSFLVLESILDELSNIDGIVMYSFFQLPQDEARRKEIFNISVPVNFGGYRIDKFLYEYFKELSRTRLQNLIREGEVQLNNDIIKDSAKKIKNNDQIKINFPAPKKTYIKPNKIPLDILYDDDDIIIINKLPGVVVHPGTGNYEKTIVNGLLYQYENSLSSIGG